MTTTAIAAIYRCPACKSEYPTAAEAEACRTIKPWPEGTQLAVRGDSVSWVTSDLWIVGGMDPRGGVNCLTFTSLRPHPLFKEQARLGGASGICLMDVKREPSPCQYRPLTLEAAASSATELEKWAKDYRKKAELYEKRAAVLRSFVDGTFVAPKRR